MNFDKLSEGWQATNAKSATVEQREQLIATTCRRVERMAGTILRRDLIETAAAIVVIVAFGGMALSLESLVSRMGAGFVVLWAIFIIWKLHRARTMPPPAPLDAPLSETCRIELDRLDRQIQLLRGVLWWYIAPAIFGANMVFIGQAGFGVDARAYLVVTLLIAWGIYWLNLKAVAKSLLPLRDELDRGLRQLQDDGTNAETGDEDHRTAAETPSPHPEAGWSKLRRTLSILLILAAMGYVAAVVVAASRDYPKRAPYTGVRWQGDIPEVKIAEQWFTLVSLDGISAEEIVAFSRWTYGKRWKKRFEQDLVEVLTRMGHPPKDTVQLVVLPLGSPTLRTVEYAPMTEANRQKIYNAAGDAEHDPK